MKEPHRPDAGAAAHDRASDWPAEAADTTTRHLAEGWPTVIGGDEVFAEQVGREAAKVLWPLAYRAARQDAAEAHDALRERLHADRVARNRASRPPPYLTQDEALSEFRRYLALFPAATPEVIAVDLFRRVDQWDEVRAVEAALTVILRERASRGEDTKDEIGVPQWMNDAAEAAIAVLGDVARARDLVQRWQADRGAFPAGAAPVLEEVAELLTGDGHG